MSYFSLLFFRNADDTFMKSILMQSNNNSTAIWPRAEADGEPQIRGKTCDRAAPDLSLTAGGGGVGRTSSSLLPKSVYWDSIRMKII